MSIMSIIVALITCGIGVFTKEFIPIKWHYSYGFFICAITQIVMAIFK